MFFQTQAAHHQHVALINLGELRGCESYENSARAHNIFYSHGSLMKELAAELNHNNDSEFMHFIINENDIFSAQKIAHFSIANIEDIDTETKIYLHFIAY